MELFAVMGDHGLPDQQQWQIALLKLALPWRFEVTSRPDAVAGFCPMRAGKVVSGVEIHTDTLDALPGHPPLDQPHRVIAFRWSGDMLECACAFSAAAALAEACGAAIYDPSEGLARVDPMRLTSTAAKLSADALEEAAKSLSVEKVVRAVSKMPEMDWRFVVDNRIVCRSMEGPYLRGIHVGPNILGRVSTGFASCRRHGAWFRTRFTLTMDLSCADG